MGRTSRKSRGKALGPYRRNRTTGTNLVSNKFLPSIRKIDSPRLSRSLFDHSCRGALNKRLILSRWSRSETLLAFSDSFFLARFPAWSPSISIFCPFLDTPPDWRSAGFGFTAANSASSSSATTGFDRDQFVMTSNRGEEKKRLRLERAATTPFSSDSAPDVEEAGSTGRIAFSRPLRYSSPSLERFPPPAFVSRSGCCRVDKLAK